MKKGLGIALCALGVMTLLAGFGSWDSDIALGFRAVGAALLITGIGVRSATSASGRVWVGLLGMALFIPGLVALPLFAFLRLSILFPLAVSWEVWLFLGLATVGGCVLAVAGTERGIALSDRHERLHADLAFLMGQANQSKARPARDRRAGAVFLLSLLAVLGIAVGRAGLPLAQLPGLLIAAWFVAQGTIALHEIAHALCGWCFGHDVVGMVIGGGPVLARFALGSVSVELGLFPGHGRVHFRFGATPVWRGMRQVAWAGPASGIVPLCAGAVGMVSFASNSIAFWISAFAASWGVISLGQLIPERIRLAHRVAYTDGMWLFLPEPVLRQIVVVLELARMRLGLPGATYARAAMPRFVEFWERLEDEPEDALRTSVLAALASAVAQPALSSVNESDMCELFLLGALTRLSLNDGELGGLEAAVDAYVAGHAPLLFKTRALDLVSCALLFPPRAESLALSERWARRAVQLLPNDVTLYGTLGVALVERGEKDEGRRHLRHLLEHSRSTADRRLAQRYLKR